MQLWASVSTGVTRDEIPRAAALSWGREQRWDITPKGIGCSGSNQRRELRAGGKGKDDLGAAAAVNSSMGPILYVKLHLFSRALLNRDQGKKWKKELVLLSGTEILSWSKAAGRRWVLGWQWDGGHGTDTSPSPSPRVLTAPHPLPGQEKCLGRQCFLLTWEALQVPLFYYQAQPCP